ncbi:MAG: helix-turn-helix domain-containing protein [Prevotella sp.]|jgi:HTH-type transcriptional regulator/antitoxin HigA|nr:helix-turn-helix domain-containing protein [Prevotella sp.]
MKSITNDKEYNAIVKRIDELLEIVTDENYNTIPEAIELNFLSDLIEEYEKKHYPVTRPSLNDVIRLRMYEMNINQAELAKLLGVSPSRITEYLNGKEPSLKVARVMCEKLNISANVILGVNNRQMIPV